jgi:hypothetical protein
MCLFVCGEEVVGGHSMLVQARDTVACVVSVGDAVPG